MLFFWIFFGNFDVEKEFDRFLSLSIFSREMWKIIQFVGGDVLLSQVIFLLFLDNF